MSKHTPGPWQAEQAGMQGKIIEWFVRVDGDDIAIASAICDRAGNVSESNARLIAAAPDLLEALEIVKQWDIENFALDIPIEIRKKMQAAIAKARGQGR